MGWEDREKKLSSKTHVVNIKAKQAILRRGKIENDSKL